MTNDDIAAIREKEATKKLHKAARVDNLMYKGCEPHWKCTVCGECVPFHCYNKEQFEQQECKGDQP